MKAIFISYRRGDTEGEAGRLFTDLVGEFGKNVVAQGSGRPDPCSAGAANEKKSVSGLIAATGEGSRSISMIVSSSVAVLLVILASASMVMSKESSAPAWQEPATVAIPTPVGESLATAERMWTEPKLQLGTVERGPASKDAAISLSPRRATMSNAPETQTELKTAPNQEIARVDGQETSQSAPTPPAASQGTPDAGALAPKQVVPNIDGSWHQVQNICLKWDISQHGDAFTLAYNCAGVRFKGSGTIRGLIMEYSYNAVNLLGIRSKGTCTGVISSDGTSFHINSCMDNLAGYLGPSDFVRPGADQ